MILQEMFTLFSHTRQTNVHPVAQEMTREVTGKERLAGYYQTTLIRGEVFL